MAFDPKYIAYQNGQLSMESVPLKLIADTFGTPVYCYSQSRILENYRSYQTAFESFNPLICYAIKANCNLAVIRALADLGAGADVVSGGELLRALKGGIAADKVAFAGVGKSQSEMQLGLSAGIKQFNVESEPELEALQKVAADMQKTATVVLRINPDVDAKTHEKITTGKKDNKFGIDYDLINGLVRKIKAMPNLRLDGLGMHIGSQLTSLDVFEDSYKVMRALTLRLRQDGFNLGTVDVGGGLGISYQGQRIPSTADLALLTRRYFEDMDCHLVLAPGRSIVADAGVLLTRVMFVKQTSHRRFVICDGAMNDLIRPTLYSAHHEVVAVDEAREKTPKTVADLVGPVCESGDYLAQHRPLPEYKSGDLLVLADAGAYGASMSSEYNSRPLAPEVMIYQGKHALVRKRPDFDDMIRLEQPAPWQS